MQVQKMSGLWFRNLCATLFLASLVAPLGCSSKSGDAEDPSAGAAKAPAVVVEFPDGDPSVSAEDGGPGFTGEGWETADPGYLGDPKAVKGGLMRVAIREWPGNLRMAGTGYNTWLNYAIRDLCYQSLLGMNPNTLDYIPGLASHWQISEDKMTFRFRINPKAHWSDGKPVVADDVVASFKMQLDPTLQEPSGIMTYGKLNEPVAKSKYIVEVTAKEQNWRNFMYFAGALTILPAHEIGSITGKEYLDKYNYSYTAVTGPYIVRPEDIRKNDSVTLTRRDDFWAKDEKQNTGLYNFDRIKFEVVRDEQLAFEKVKKGELDYYMVGRAEWWAKDLKEVPAVKKGWLVMRKFFTEAPNGTSGFAINQREAPLDDVRVRKALAYLYDRETLIEKLCYGEYEPLDSYFQGGEYQNPDNEVIRYNPSKAAELLAEAGWKERGSDGYLVKDGKPLRLTLTWYSELTEKFLTSYKEACKQVGVDIVLDRTNPETMWKNLMERKFQMVSIAWGGLIFPNPETSFHGSLADQNDNNNITGVNIARVDELCKEYDVAYTQEERRRIIREIDGLVFKEHPYVLQWYQPCQRVAYWNKFGMPEWGLHRFSEWEDAFSSWWVDPEKAEALKEARKNDSKLEVPPIENKYWIEKAEEMKTAAK